VAFGRGGGSSEANAFERLLDEAHAGSTEAPLDPPPPLKINLPGPMPLSAGGGGEARWRSAMDWTSELEGRAAPLSPAALPALSGAHAIEEVKRDLGLDRRFSPEELASRRRAFLWRNHPDRQPAEKRAEANARVAIANALHDQARRERGR
jgi:hypothetical protein